MAGEERDHAVNLAGRSGDLTSLAIEIGRMRYDAQAFLLRALAEEIARQATADRGRNRPRLAARLDIASADLDRTAQSMMSAWTLCRSHVSHELELRPELQLPDDGGRTRDR